MQAQPTDVAATSALSAPSSTPSGNNLAAGQARYRDLEDAPVMPVGQGSTMI